MSCIRELTKTDIASGGPTVPGGRSGRAATRFGAIGLLRRLRRAGRGQFAKSMSRDDLNPHGAESCRCATRPVLRTRPGHPESLVARPSDGGAIRRPHHVALALLALALGATATADAQPPNIRYG